MVVPPFVPQLVIDPGPVLTIRRITVRTVLALSIRFKLCLLMTVPGTLFPLKSLGRSLPVAGLPTAFPLKRARSLVKVLGARVYLVKAPLALWRSPRILATN